MQKGLIETEGEGVSAMAQLEERGVAEISLGTDTPAGETSLIQGSSEQKPRKKTLPRETVAGGWGKKKRSAHEKNAYFSSSPS